MVKRLNKFMTILTLVGAGVVGVSSFSDETINAFAYQDNNMHYVATKWNLWDKSDDNDGSKLLSIKTDGGLWQDNFGEMFNNKTGIFGSKDIYINLKGLYNLSFTDHHNKQYHNYIYGNISADSIMFDDSYMRFLLNGESVASFDMIDIRDHLNESDDFYIISQNDSYEYRHGYEVGYYDGYDLGHDDGYNKGYDDGLTMDYHDGYYLGHAHGYNDGRASGYDDGYNLGHSQGYKKGYDDGLQDPAGFGGLLSTVFGGLGSLLAIELLPNIYLGAIIAVPLVFGIIFFILGKRKGD